MKRILKHSSLLALSALFAAGFILPCAAEQTTRLSFRLAENNAGQTAPSSRREKVAALNARSDALVEKVKTGKADAADFRISVTLYRESLRELMLANEHAAAAERIAQPGLMEMVRMAALLQAARNCETGRYLVCPPDLMDRLIRQQSAVAEVLKKQTQAN
jgi:hypothetical protein